MMGTHSRETNKGETMNKLTINPEEIKVGTLLVEYGAVVRVKSVKVLTDMEHQTGNNLPVYCVKADFVEGDKGRFDYLEGYYQGNAYRHWTLCER